MGLENDLKRGVERDINQAAFKFTTNVSAVRRRVRCTTCTLRECFLKYSMTVLGCILYIVASIY